MSGLVNNLHFAARRNSVDINILFLILTVWLRWVMYDSLYYELMAEHSATSYIKSLKIEDSASARSNSAQVMCADVGIPYGSVENPEVGLEYKLRVWLVKKWEGEVLLHVGCGVAILVTYGMELGRSRGEERGRL